MKSLLFVMMFCLTVLARGGTYDFRASEAYRKLAPADRQRLEQVRREQVLLWGALDMYADEHNGEVPETLDALVPRYLAELPNDPFATAQTAGERELPGYVASKDGWGYRLKPGVPGNRAWVISSVGLPDFPYLAEHGNVSLYICKGVWISGKNPATGHLFKDPQNAELANPQGAGGESKPAEPKH
jgi:hypothetical protein